MKKIIAIGCTLLALTSCGEENNNTEVSTSGVINSIEKIQVGAPEQSKAPVFKEKKVKTELIDGTLKIGGNVLIKRGMSESFPKEIPVLPNGEIYQNSNMKNYAFIITKQETEKVYNFYNTELPKIGWENKNATPDGEKGDKLDEKEKNASADLLIQAAKEKRQETPLEGESNAGGDLVFVNKEMKKELSITISEIIPQVLVETLKLEGKFIEMQITDIVESQEEEKIEEELEQKKTEEVENKK